MIQVETSVTMERPPEAVFALVNDPRAGCSWPWGVPNGPRPAERLAEVVFSEPSHRLAVRHRFGEVTCDAVYHFDAGGRGTCVTWTARVSATGRCRAVETLIGQAMALEAEIGLAMLKHLLEDEA